MKRFLCLFVVFLFVLSSIHAQDTIFFRYNKKAYVERAIQEYKAEKIKTKDLTGFEKKWNSYYMIFEAIENLDFVVIPVFQLKSIRYSNKTSIEEAILWRNDVDYQKVLYKRKDKRKIYTLGIYDSFCRDEHRRDSISGYMRIGFGVPILPDLYISDNKIFSYIKAHPERFVFMIKGFDGFWTVAKERIFKLTRSIWGLNKRDANWYLSRNYGLVYINHIINGGMRAGYPYFLDDVYVERHPPKVRIIQ